jgi:hypothetical protein
MPNHFHGVASWLLVPPPGGWGTVIWGRLTGLVDDEIELSPHVSVVAVLQLLWDAPSIGSVSVGGPNGGVIQVWR